MHVCSVIKNCVKLNLELSSSSGKNETQILPIQDTVHLCVMVIGRFFHNPLNQEGAAQSSPEGSNFSWQFPCECSLSSLSRIAPPTQKLERATKYAQSLLPSVTPKTGGACHLLFPDTINSNIFVNFYCTQDTEYVMPHRDPKTWSVFTGDV